MYSQASRPSSAQGTPQTAPAIQATQGSSSASQSQSASVTRGEVFLLAVPAHLTHHVRWGLERVLHDVPPLRWEPQPAKPTYLSANLSWAGPVGTAAQLASALRVYTDTYFEITERSTATSGALRLMHVPQLGICSIPVDQHGNFLVTEDRVRYAFEQAAGSYEALLEHFSQALGQAWDDELEPLRATPALRQLGGLIRARTQGH